MDEVADAIIKNIDLIAVPRLVRLIRAAQDALRRSTSANAEARLIMEWTLDDRARFADNTMMARKTRCHEHPRDDHVHVYAVLLIGVSNGDSELFRGSQCSLTAAYAARDAKLAAARAAVGEAAVLRPPDERPLELRMRSPLLAGGAEDVDYDDSPAVPRRSAAERRAIAEALDEELREIKADIARFRAQN